MKKTRNKIFFVICFILSSFLIGFLTIYNYRTYNEAKESIEKTLRRMYNPSSKNNDTEKDIIFMDTLVYTVSIEDNEIIDVTSHTEQNISDEDIIDIAESIIDNKKDRELYIGNLYLNNYSYSYQNKGTYLIIVDNTITQKELQKTLKISIFLFIYFETIIILLSYLITSWIIKPMEETFNKQKQFIADASHELKTPLTVITANAEMLENDPKEKKWLNNIRSEADRMSNLVTNLLDLARIENSSSKKLYEEIDLSKLVEKTILPFESLMYEKNIKLEYNIKDNIKLNCDQEQIRELIVILIDNAIKHSSKEGHIKINLEKEKDIIFTITDKGDAISKEDQEKIFERFYRHDKSRNRNDNRYGLGLAIAKEIVDNHNGKISCYSEYGYTTFKVIFK